MTPSARVQAAIEILDLVIAAARSNGPAADTIIADWFRTRRFAGSSDRRAVRELAYGAIRICGEVPQSGRAALLTLAKDDPALCALFDGSPHAPAPIAEKERYARPGIAPAWLEKLLAASDVTGDVLGRAPLDLRVNSLRAVRETLDLFIDAELNIASNGLRLPFGTQIEHWPAYKDGLIEVQDAGSQLVCEAVAARPGETIIDLCAGAGGKTLALAADMENCGALLACDTDRGRLSRLPQRAARAGVTIAETLLLNPGHEAEALAAWQGRNATGADAVLVDAPCSGSGTWRRNPEARWRLSPRELEKTAKLQARLLDLAAVLLRPGGRLVYAVCSLLDGEGADQVSAFLARQPAFRSSTPELAAGTPRGSGLRLTPFQDGTDGFFVARLLRL